MGMIGNDEATQELGRNGDGFAVVRMLRIQAVLGRVGIARSTVYEWMNPKSPRYDPTFPRSVKLSPGRKRSAVGWIESEVTRWIESRATDGRQTFEPTVEQCSYEMADDVAQALGWRTR